MTNSGPLLPGQRPLNIQVSLLTTGLPSCPPFSLCTHAAFHLLQTSTLDDCPASSPHLHPPQHFSLQPPVLPSTSLLLPSPSAFLCQFHSTGRCFSSNGIKSKMTCCQSKMTQTDGDVSHMALRPLQSLHSHMSPVSQTRTLYGSLRTRSSPHIPIRPAQPAA